MANQQTSTVFLGKNMQCLRKAKGLSREKFAELTDVSSRMVYDWENGVSLPGVERLVLIASVLEVSIDSMLTEM